MAWLPSLTICLMPVGTEWRRSRRARIRTWCAGRLRPLPWSFARALQARNRLNCCVSPASLLLLRPLTAWSTLPFLHPSPPATHCLVCACRCGRLQTFPEGLQATRAVVVDVRGLQPCLSVTARVVPACALPLMQPTFADSR